MAPIFHIASLLAGAEGLRTRDRAAVAPPVGGARDSVNEAYTFDDFVREFGRAYAAGSDEYTHREAVFASSLLQINSLNARTGRSWTAGVYPFMDWTTGERVQRLHGYEPKGSRRVLEGEPLMALQTGAEELERVYGEGEDGFDARAPAVHNQGGLCGSCWAFAAVEAVEAQLMRDGSAWPQKLGEPRLSVQSVLDCVANPRHCGGTGGCDGATPELAFDNMKDIGIPLEADLPYHPLQADNKNCPMKKSYPKDWMHVTLSGWRSLPTNRAQPLMHTLVKEGPVVVAADSHKWWPYKSGIFDGCPRDSIPNHSVLATGYGVDNGQKYWKIQNSWGDRWGEEGSIRILRHDNEDHWCGTDTNPEEGFLCEGEAHRNVTVCGTCGLLFDPIIPQIGSVGLGQVTYSADSSAAAAAKLEAEAAEATEEAAVPEADVSEASVPDAVPLSPSTTAPQSTEPARTPSTAYETGDAVLATSPVSHAESDVPDALARQLEDAPEDVGGENEMLDRAAKRVQAGEQELAQQLQESQASKGSTIDEAPQPPAATESALPNLDLETLDLKAEAQSQGDALGGYLSAGAKPAHPAVSSDSQTPAREIHFGRSNFRTVKTADPMDVYLSRAAGSS